MSEFSPSIISYVNALAGAIVLAEGGNVEGSLPWRIHNPGDLELGDRGWGVEKGKTIYLKADPNASLFDQDDGYSALRRQCYAILSGQSHTIPLLATFMELSNTWTGGDNSGAWCKIVCGKLGVEPLNTLAEWVKS